MSSAPVVIVTGASAGIGAAIVDKLLSEKAKVVLVDITEEPLERRQKKYGHERVQYVVGDVSTDKTNHLAAKAALDAWGKVDALALNSGVMLPVKRLSDFDSTEWTRIFNINVVSQISMLVETIPSLRKTKGRVVFTLSDAGEKPTFAAWGAYGATKAAVNYLIRVLALEEPEITSVGLSWCREYPTGARYIQRRRGFEAVSIDWLLNLVRKRRCHVFRSARTLCGGLAAKSVAETV